MDTTFLFKLEHRYHTNNPVLKDNFKWNDEIYITF